MGFTLELPPAVASSLKSEADERGLTLTEYAVELLSRPRLDSSEVRTGADLVRYWEEQGVIGSRPDIADAASHARQLRETAQRRS